MKLTDQTRFPWPVLWDATDDYPGRHIELAVKIEEEMPSEKIKIDYEVQVDSETLKAGMTNNTVGFGIQVVSRETMYTELFKSASLVNSILIPPGTLRGQLLLRAYFWSAIEMRNLPSSELHSEYHDREIIISKNNVLGVSNAVEYSIGSDKQAPWGTIFELAAVQGLEDGRITVDLAGDRVVIGCSDATKKSLDNLRAALPGQIVMLNGIYLPVVMDLLSAMEADGVEHEGKRWYQVIDAKLKSRAIKLDGTYFQPAQTLLDLPCNMMAKTDVRAAP
jgi:hypothetical protein